MLRRSALVLAVALVASVVQVLLSQPAAADAEPYIVRPRDGLIRLNGHGHGHGDGLSRNQIRQPLSDQATEASRGVIRNFAGQPIQAPVNSSNGGWTVYGGQSYLVAKPDPYAPRFGWGEADFGGRVLTVRLDGTSGSVSVSGMDLVSQMTGLGRSSWFEVMQSADDHLPYGSIDEASAVGTGLRIRGWTVDADLPAQSLAVHVYDAGPDGVVRPSFLTADQLRPDVAAALGMGSHHGFSATVPTQGRGVHRVCLYAINVGSGASNPSLGCQSVLVGEPLGSLDAIQIGAGTAFVEGWALDPLFAASAVSVAVYDADSSGTRGYGPFAAPGRRDDVAVAFADIGAGPFHGFSAPIPLAIAGSHRFCAYALAEGGAGPNRLVGCRTVVVTAPTGQLDDVSVDGAAVRVRGWALDPGHPVASLEVHVYVRMAGGTWSRSGIVADQTRLDVATAYPTAGGSHGYTASVPVGSHGAADVCAYAIASGSGAGNQLLGCRSVTVP